MALRILETHMQKNERGHFSYIIHNNGLKVDEVSQWVGKPSESSGELGSTFSTSAATTSRRVSRGKGKKWKMKYGDFIKKEHFHSKGISVIKKQPTEWEKIFGSVLSD